MNFEPHRRWVIAYDVSHPKRLRATAKACETHATRVQKSVFEVSWDASQKRNLLDALTRHITADDSLLAQPLCRRCQRGIQTLGRLTRLEERPFWIV